MTFQERFPTATRYRVKDRSGFYYWACRINQDNAEYLKAVMPSGEWGFYIMSKKDDVERQVGGFKFESENCIHIYTCGWALIVNGKLHHFSTHQAFEDGYTEMHREGKDV